MIEEPEAILMQMNIAGGMRANGEVKWMGFHGDRELLVAIVRELATLCGPQVFFADSDGVPWIVVSSDAKPIGPTTTIH